MHKLFSLLFVSLLFCSATVMAEDVKKSELHKQAESIDAKENIAKARSTFIHAFNDYANRGQVKLGTECAAKAAALYYKENFYAELFYYTPEVVDEEGDFSLTFTAGRHKDEPSKAKWDFYLQNHQLLHLENGAKTAMCVKMWRKGDFDRLVEHVQKNYNDFITIENCL